MGSHELCGVGGCHRFSRGTGDLIPHVSPASLPAPLGNEVPTLTLLPTVVL